jgi:hypothetical protein
MNLKPLKSNAREQLREQQRPHREQRALVRRCFWTWPWGHVWAPTTNKYVRECAVCRTTKNNLVF